MTLTVPNQSSSLDLPALYTLDQTSLQFVHYIALLQNTLCCSLCKQTCAYAPLTLSCDWDAWLQYLLLPTPQGMCVAQTLAAVP